MSLNEIVVEGAREHNLKSIDLRIPRSALTTITGVSGSGKSSLAFDTIFQEGQRRFIESLSAYARQFLGNLDKPRVDRVDGLSPTISIDQKTVNRNPRSTVGTITEIHDHLRLLFARLGEAHCPKCGRGLVAQTRDQIADRLLGQAKGGTVQVLAPIIRGRKGEYRKDLEGLRLKGFVRARIDGTVRRLDEEISLSRYQKHTIEVVVDRLRATAERRGRLAEAVEAAFKLADGVVAALIGEEHALFSSRLACPDCELDFPELEPRLFSFNSPYGACRSCSGLGMSQRFDPRLLVPDENLSIREGAIATTSRTGYVTYSRLGPESLERVASAFRFSLDTPWKDLTEEQRNVLLFGSGTRKLRLSWEYVDGSSGRTVRGSDHRPLRGLIPSMERAYKVTRTPHLEKYMSRVVCGLCEGTRLRPEARAVTFRDRAISDLSAATVEELCEWFSGLELRPAEEQIGREVLREIRSRLRFLADVGLGYLPLDRGARTLSGGEAQRVRLATQVGSQLQGVLYVLDEPSIGLHQRDNHRLIRTLQQLRDRGNTVLVVEHDRDTMLASDFLVDIGPGAGNEGGHVVASGRPEAVFRSATSVTAQFLRGERSIAMPRKTRQANRGELIVRGARHHNLKNIDVRIPLGCFVVMTGVSGSGKSTLLDRVLKRALARDLHGAREPVGEHDRIEGAERIDKVIEIGQAPIGRTPRSNPATYSGALTHIRDLFAMLPESKARGYLKGRFSFNVAGGRCEECGGAGVKVVEMQFLADVEIPCDECGGLRYNRETLEVEYRSKNIRQVLEMTVVEAAAFFEAHPKLGRVLKTMCDVGLGYVRLGQTATTLSGGEAQRLKLARELGRPGTGSTLYLLDEPTTGLHFADIECLLSALAVLVDSGNTVVVIEHNMDVIKTADRIIDLGPEGGKGGGEVVFYGTPRQAMRSKTSWTGRLLKEYLLPPSPNRSPVVKESGPGGEVPLRVVGASVNNLKRLDVEIPRGSFTVVTGVSGSGKTSLAFDTIFSEAQRRFVESMSTYARRFLSRMDRAPVDLIEGLSPAVAIDRRAASKNPRSTVATSTEIHDYLRVLYARVGTAHCPECGRVLEASPPGLAARETVARFPGRKIHLLAPLYRKSLGGRQPLERPARFLEIREELLKEGFVRYALDGEELRLEDAPPRRLAEVRRIDLIVDRVLVRGSSRTRLAESFEQAYRRGNNLALVRDQDGEERLFTREPACPAHGIRLAEEPHPRLFSFNSHLGACGECDGLGRLERCDEDRLIENPGRPLFKGALVAPWKRTLSRRHFGVSRVLSALAERHDFDLDAPFGDLPEAVRRIILRGHPDPVRVEVVRNSRHSRREYSFDVKWAGICGMFEAKYQVPGEGRWWRQRLHPLMVEGECPACHGERLNPLSRSFRLGGKTLGELSRLTVEEALRFFRELKLEGSRGEIAREILKEIQNRIEVLNEIGLDYLQLDRRSSTLSGGEAQRLRLATQLGNRLVGVLYVLDEPTIGLHPRDTARLIETLENLKQLGNTILVVEHDLDVIRAADYLIDIGPGAGHRGGQVVSAGPVSHVENDPRSLTGAYLRNQKQVPLPAARRDTSKTAIRLEGACLHNLRSLDVSIPAGAMTCVTGVSGSGKSTLVMDLLEPAVRRRLRGDRDLRGTFQSLSISERVRNLAVVDQSPLGPTPSSNPATYTGIFDRIREVFAATPEARMRGFQKGRFSFNLSGGRCEACEGRGMVQVEMHFLSDVYVTCEACEGKRFERETLGVTFGGKSIADVLEMEVCEALEFFRNHPRIRRTLRLLDDVGLGYLRLGQSATTLSGGEAQRVKLASELAGPARGETLYLLDEPTTGLHLDDVARLVAVLGRLVDGGNTVLVIEHNPDVVKCADHVIDLGPEGGLRGGRLVVQGTPEDVAACGASHTGQRLRQELTKSRSVSELEHTA
ncbi:MAG: excinuclease ABC subunit UvrA [Planctomycetota bacterium]